MSLRVKTSLAIASMVVATLLSFTALAATGATKDEAVAMVKKAVSAIKSDGPDKAYADIDDKGDRSSIVTSISSSTASTGWCSPMVPMPS